MLTTVALRLRRLGAGRLPPFVVEIPFWSVAEALVPIIATGHFSEGIHQPWLCNREKGIRKNVEGTSVCGPANDSLREC